MGSDIWARLRERQARNDARYDRPPPRWAPLVPPLGSAVLLVIEILFPARPRHGGPFLAASGVYLGLLLVWSVIAWRWHRRHLVAADTVAFRWRRLLELGPQTRAKNLAPLGFAFSGFIAVVTTIHLIEQASGGSWVKVVGSSIGLLVWILVLLRTGLATRRLLGQRTLKSQR